MAEDDHRKEEWQEEGDMKNGSTPPVHELVREHIQARDRLIEAFGMEIMDVGPGCAELRMTVSDAHLNAADLCHGAAIFALADVAFALACNSHGRQALALEVSVNYLRPARKGETLTARASELNLGNTTGLYRIVVENQDARKVAYLKATAYRLEGSFV